jgi:hypothetical protein
MNGFFHDSTLLFRAPVCCLMKNQHGICQDNRDNLENAILPEFGSYPIDERCLRKAKLRLTRVHDARPLRIVESVGRRVPVPGITADGPPQHLSDRKKCKFRLYRQTPELVGEFGADERS